MFLILETTFVLKTTSQNHWHWVQAAVLHFHKDRHVTITDLSDRMVCTQECLYNASSTVVTVGMLKQAISIQRQQLLILRYVQLR